MMKTIKDNTGTDDLVNLRRAIYETIMLSLDFEHAGHKLLKLNIKPGQEMEICTMLIECCSGERSYLPFYGLLGQWFCMIKKTYQEGFKKCFLKQYSIAHKLETNNLRNLAMLFANLLATAALGWDLLGYIRLTEEDTTSASRIFIKYLFLELSEILGVRLLNKRLTDPAMDCFFEESIFPKDSPRNTKFAINFFTCIGLGCITNKLHEYLKNLQEQGRTLKRKRRDLRTWAPVHSTC